ncbi:VARLMGL domain-containing protein [Cephalotus follicularis]|uniref:VARLMGL domain-containing protein n=1 Tax=Cephalotus follicularis TaxID=3775 RepID=A0A1Q3BFG9_CEPFO|nr:VARLMGL domain-containing protein [Cephalotus follicularis]
MKLLSTSPSISSSSNTGFLDANLPISKSATAGCFAGILRRVLCSRTLPTHPSDHLTETSSLSCEKHQELSSKEKREVAAAPGIVARLMGLDSSAEINLSCASIGPNTISRSRSMNSVDCEVNDDQIQGWYRRVKSTMSFREMPTFLELENDDFIVMSFEEESESNYGNKERKCEVGFEELKGRRKVKYRNKENKEERVLEKMMVVDKETNKMSLNKMKCSSRRTSNETTKRVYYNANVKDSTDISLPLKDSDEKSHFAFELAKRSKCRISKELFNAAECTSEESSPVSVLDFGQFTIDHQVLNSEEDDKRSAESSTRRKLSSELENCKQISPANNNNNNNNNVTDKDKKLKIDENHGARKKECHNGNYLDFWSEIINRITEVEMKAPTWKYHKISMVEEFEVISEDFGSQILHQLLDELVDQLVGPMHNLNL